MKKGLILLLIAVLLVGVFTACGGSSVEANEAEAVENNDNHAIVGVWELQYEGYFEVIEFKADGTMTITDEDGQVFVGVYEIVGNLLIGTIEGEEEYSYEYEISGNILTMTDPEGVTHRFRRIA